jgi:hypothetical protein
MGIVNIHCEIMLSFDPSTDRIKVKDQFGEYIPFPVKMWQQCVEYPYHKYFYLVGKSYEYVVEIFIEQYRHRYICNN